MLVANELEVRLGVKELRSYLQARVWGGRPGAAQAFPGELLRVREGACLAPLYLHGWGGGRKREGLQREGFTGK